MLPDDTYPIVSITSYPPTSPSHHREEGRKEESWTYKAVEERLVEAVALWRRLPDRERGWHWVKCLWPVGQPEVDPWLDWADLDAAPRPLPLSRAQVARMNEAGEWVGQFVPERDRQLVGIALGYMASDRAVPWRKIKHRLGIRFGEDGLRKRYSRGITHVVKGLERSG